MTTTEHTRLAVVAEERLVRIVPVVYSIDELTKLTGESAGALWRRIHRGTLAARHTGRRYLVTGPAAVDAGLWNASTLVDYRQVIDVAVKYTLQELATLLGLSYWTARRLVSANRITAVNGRTVRVEIRGQSIVDYLDGRDEPMQHPESA
jgi:hypothetical protein